MNLSDAYAYKEFIENVINNASLYISDNNLLIEDVEHHKVSDAGIGKENFEKIIGTGSRYKASDVIELIQNLICELENLSDAICYSKDSCDYYIESMQAVQKEKKVFLDELGFAVSKVPHNSTIKESGRSYDMCGDGDQVVYRYDIDVEQRYIEGINDIKEELHKERKKLREDENLLKRIMLDTTVDFNPKYDIEQSFEEIMEDMMLNEN